MKTRSLPFDALLLAGLAVLAFQLAGPILTIPLHIPLNYNEGWNATFDTRAVDPAAGPLYPPADTFVFNNYPPLGFYLVGALGRYIVGDMIVTGRVVALLSLLAAAALTGACVRHLGGKTRPALASALIVPLFICSYFRIYVAVDDPQWLAQAIMLAGLTVLLCGNGSSRLAGGEVPLAKLAASALLMVTGAFVKHNLVALPAATVLWLICLNRRAAATWIATALTGLGIGAAATAALHGQAAFADILHHHRVFRGILMKYSGEALAPMLPMFAVTTVLLGLTWRPGRRDASVLFVALFGSMALFAGVVQRAGEGVYYNAQFETLVASGLGFGLALSRLEPLSIRGTPIGPTALAVFAALPLIGAWPFTLPRAWDDISDRSARAAAWKPVIDRIAAAPGPAGCLMISLCWWAGKPSEIDMFNLTEKSVLAHSAPARFRSDVEHRHFAIFEDDPASFTHRNAIHRLGYDPIMSLFTRFYAPTFAGPNGIVLLAPTR